MEREGDGMTDQRTTRGNKTRFAILAFIDAYEAERGRVPTGPEIAKGVDRVKSSIHTQLCILEQRGHLAITRGRVGAYIRLGPRYGWRKVKG